MNKVIYFPHKPLSGGPGTFQILIENHLEKLGWDICHDTPKPNTKVAFIVGGTAKVATLIRLKLKGVKIIHRLDGMLYPSRFENYGIKQKLRILLINSLLNIIRRYFADYVVYQTKFVKDWWYDKYGAASVPEFIIPNGSSSHYNKIEMSPSTTIRIICVEGNIPSDKYVGDLLSFIASLNIDGKSIVLTLIGNYDSKLFEYLKRHENIHFLGKVKREDVSVQLLKNDLFLSLDLNAACPNSVIEAMHAGLPIIGFDTGALYEICNDVCGKLLISFEGERFEHKYTGDFSRFRLSISELMKNIEINKELTFRHAKEKLSAEIMVNKYMSIIKLIEI